ncbi:hypothetical protein V865_000469 [Kwoniella europaea PYCC6329]|uniref:Uncharacterized protein n=1 Tax=Kwoniella europaea PYCC6329 TaxID=1423913 RepID=A0AAX4K9V8_9TREE
MYPYNHSIDPNAPPFNPPPRTVQPHPLNQNFRFPPLPPDIPQQSISQPQPHHPQEPYGHSRRPSQLNPSASSFSFKPLEVSPSVDNGVGRLKRYHDDPSALGIDYGEPTEEPYERRVSPRKKALARAMEYTPPIEPINYNYNQSYSMNNEPIPTQTSTNYNLPPHVIPQFAQAAMPAPTPTLHIQHDSQHYTSDRAMLGISRSATVSPQFNIHPAQTFQTPPPPLNRAWTLDSSSRTALSPLNQSHQGLPLTLSPLHTHIQQGRISPSHSVISAPYDSRSISSPIGDRRIVSLSPNFGQRRQDSISLPSSERKYRGYRAKEGGPPKAVLGGPGGKTFDEMLASKTSPNLSPSKGPSSVGELSTSSRQVSGASSNSEYRYKGNPITFKLPPSTYSPPDSPPKPLPLPESTDLPIGDQDEMAEGKEEITEEQRKPRKEAFPWPKSRIRLSPTGVPLPLSPDQPGEDTLRRPSIDSSTDKEQEVKEGMWKGKPVLVSFPDEGCWERLRPPTPSEAEAEELEEHDETEAEVSAVLGEEMPVSPIAEDEDGEDSKSFNIVEDTVPAQEKDIIPWDEYPLSPSRPVMKEDDDPDVDHQQVIRDKITERIALVPHPSLPPRPVTRDDRPPPSYSSELISLSKRSFSDAPLGNTIFLKKQLGGVLKDSEERKERRTSISSTRHVKPICKGSSVGSWKQYDDMEVEGKENAEVIAEEIGHLPSPKGKSKMGAWSDHEDEADDEVEEEDEKVSISSPGRLINDVVGIEQLHRQLPAPAQDELFELDAEIIKDSTAKVDIEVAPKSGSMMRAWSDEEPNMVWEQEDQLEPESVSSPARLEQPSSEFAAEEEHLPQNTNIQEQIDDVGLAQKNGSKMRAWSDDGDEAMSSDGERGIRETISSPARLEQPASAPHDGAKGAIDLEADQLEDHTADSINPGSSSRLHAWTPSPEPSKMRAWGLEEDINTVEAVSAPARMPDHAHALRKSASEEVDRWQNDKFDTSEEFEDVPLTATETSKIRPWEESTLKPVEEIDERKSTRLEKRGRVEDGEEEDLLQGGSKMRAWSQDILVSTIRDPNPVKWFKNGDEVQKQSSDFAPIPDKRPFESEQLRQKALEAKETSTSEAAIMAKMKVLRAQVQSTKGSRKKGKKSIDAVTSSDTVRPIDDISMIQEGSEVFSVNIRSSSAEDVDNNISSQAEPVQVDVTSPQAKRLRPTAEPWKPPSSTLGYGALGVSTIRPQPATAVPTLPPDAKPFVPQSTSFHFTVPSSHPVVDPNAQSFVPRSTSFTFASPILPSVTPAAPPFIPRETSFNVMPLGNEPPFTPSATPFMPPLSPHCVSQLGVNIQRQGSPPSYSSPKGKKLRPTALAFDPPRASPTKTSGFDFTLPNNRDRAASLTSSNGEKTLRPTANTFVPPYGFIPSPTKPRLQPSAIPFVPSASIASSDTVTSPIKSLATSQIRSDFDTGYSTASTILVTSPIKADASVPSVLDLPTQDRSEEDLGEIQDLARPPSTNEPILTPAEIVFEQHRPDSVESGLQVIPPGRDRANTVAFGPSSPIGGGIFDLEENESRLQSDEDEEERIEDSVVDLEWLFFETPLLTTPSVTGHDVLGIREASPRLSVSERGSRASEASHSSERSQSMSSERPPRNDRPSMRRAEENSYHPLDTLTLPLKEPIIPLKEITIHPSHPVQLPLTPRPNVEEVPDAPVSAHTTELSDEASIGSETLAHTGRPSLSRPLPPIPNPKEITPSTGPFLPAKVDEYTTPPQSTGDTFASAAYMTADGSPLIPTRIFVDTDNTPPKRLRRPLPDIPTWREPIPISTPAPSSGNAVADPLEMLEDYGKAEEDGDDQELVYPKVDIDTSRRKREFDRSAAPSPELPSEVNEVEPSPDPLTVNTKFREWTFPICSPSGIYETGHQVKPSIIRRHTMPTEDHLDDLNSPPASAEATMGVASTFASRVGELRAYLRADEEISRRTSLEFPMREDNRKLGVVNVDHDDHESSPGSAQQGYMAEKALMHDERLDEMLDLLRKRDGMSNRAQEDLDGLKDLIVSAVQDVVSQLHVQRQSNTPDSLERIASIFEENPRLLTSLRDTDKLPPTPTHQEARESHEERSQTQSQDIFAAILTGQHAILSKFDDVASTQLSGSATLSQAIEALQYAQQAAEQRAREEDDHRAIISALREETEDNRITISETRAQAEVLNQRLKDTRQDRDELRTQSDGMMSRLESMSVRQNKLEGELDGVVARALAAELERDALARSVNESRDLEDGLRSEIREYQEQLEKERENSERSINQKESEIVALQSQIQYQLSQITEQKEKIQFLEQSLPQQKEDEGEADKPKLATESSIIEMSQNALTFQEELMSRLGKLDENMYETMGSRVKEYESVLDRNRILQAEVESLRERLEASADRFAKLQLSTSSSLSAHTVAQQALCDKLSDETKRRESAETKMEEMKKELERVREEKMNWNVIASERQAMARMQEIRLQALTQENVYWRQFALEHDRRRFKSYLQTKPFRNPDGSELVVNGGGNEDQMDENKGTWYVETR